MGGVISYCAAPLTRPQTTAKNVKSKKSKKYKPDDAVEVAELALRKRTELLASGELQTTEALRVDVCTLRNPCLEHELLVNYL